MNKDRKYFKFAVAAVSAFLIMSSAEAAFQLRSRNCQKMNGPASNWENVSSGGDSGTLRFYSKVGDSGSLNCPSQLKLEPGLSVLDTLQFISSSDTQCVYRSLGYGIRVTNESEWNGARFYAIKCPNPVN